MQTPDEERELEEVIDRLTEMFPTASQDEILTAVTEEHAALTGNPIRDFVPVLVEKAAKKRLKASHEVET